MRALAACLLLAGPASAVTGRDLFSAANCSACHRVGAAGGNTGPDLTFVGFRRPKDWLERWLSSPHAVKAGTLMPEPALRPAERAGIVAYLASLRGQEAVPLAPGVGRGKALYLRAGCVACHGPAGTGGQPSDSVPGGRVPALKKAAEGYSREELVEKISRGVRPEMPAWGEALSEGEVADLADYVLSLGSGAPKEEW